MAERIPPGFNIPIEFYDGPEVKSIPRRIRAAAIGVWALCGNYSATKLTDGYVDAETLKQFGCTPAIRAALQATINVDGDDSPLWIDARDGGVQITNWPKWQRTRAEVKAYRDAEAERKRKARIEKKNGAKSSQNGSTSADAKMSGRTSAGQPSDIRAESVETETETETETKKSVGTPGGAQPPHTPPSQFCKRHPHGTPERCGDCANARKAFEAWKTTADAAEQDAFDEADARRQRVIAQRKACTDCDEHGWLLSDDGQPAEPATRCTHPNLLAVTHA